MAAPYWGQLPAPKTRRQSQDLDGSKDNRASVQTAATDAWTEPDFTPLASPAVDTGLAPRPPSLPYGQSNYPRADKHQRKASAPRYEPALSPKQTSTAPYAASQADRSPVSYQQPSDEQTMAYSQYSADPHAQVFDTDPALYYNGAPQHDERYAEEPRHPDAPVLDRSRATFDQNAGPIIPRRQTSQYRKTSVGTGSMGRRDSQRNQWADDRSPLQRLERTLDTLTKEEKRARVEAAERKAMARANEKAFGKRVEPPMEKATSTSHRSSVPQVRFEEHGTPPIPDESIHPIIENARDEPSYTLSSQNYAPQDAWGVAPTAQIPAYQPHHVEQTQPSDLPQRNLSFHQRAVGDEQRLPYQGHQGEPFDTYNPVEGSGFPVSRGGSRKLQKNPPNDPWYMPMAAEEMPAPQRRVTMPAEYQYEPHQPLSMPQSQAPPPKKLQKSPLVPRQEMDHYPNQSGGPSNDFYPADEPAASQGRMQGFAAAIGLGRSNSMARNQPTPPEENKSNAPPNPGSVVKSVKFPGLDKKESDDKSSSSISSDSLAPGHGIYQPPKYLEEWKRAPVGSLLGALLDLREPPPASPIPSLSPSPGPGPGQELAWWERGRGQTQATQRRKSAPVRPRIPTVQVEDESIPTRFNPPLYLKCGPLLRFCGMRSEKTQTRPSRNGAAPDRQIWRGSVMIVTRDGDSSYVTAPTLRLFLQPMELLPPPPVELRGGQDLPPEYVDPIAGIPKVGRRGETLHVRPVEQLEEARDISLIDDDEGLFEINRTAPDFNPNTPDPPGSFASRRRRVQVDGERLGKFRDVQGFRLHAERGCTFWRFNIEVELGETQQRVAYRINQGPQTGFWVPSRHQTMNIMFHSCNGFSTGLDSDEFSGPDPMWRDVLNTHQTQPFHVMIGGGDQIYNDCVTRQTKIFKEWVNIANPLHKANVPFKADMQDELEQFYLERYSMWFSQGLFGLANSQIPMVNMYDDHDIIDGFGSYPNHFMKCPVFAGLGNVAFKYYMLFQHQSLPNETEESEPSWALGLKPGPYINELSRSMFMSLGNKTALLAVDCRTERTRDEVVREDTWKRLMDRCYSEIVKGETEHLLVLLGVPIAYPRLVWLENILTSRLLDPLKALGKTGIFGNLINKFDGGVEVLDDLDDHWTAKNHKEERKFVVEDLQDLAADKSVRVTILSGDVHLAAMGQFFSNPKQHLAKHKDFRYMPNIISSAITNAPPPDMMADVLNKRNKVHHFDKETDEDMIPIFTHGVDGKPRNNKHLLPHRNWCSIREYAPGRSPSSTPPPESFEESPERPKGGLLRRLSLTGPRRPSILPDASQDTVDRSRPPMAMGGGGSIFRSLSRRGSTSDPNVNKKPGKLTRSLSLGRKGSLRSGSLFRRPSSRKSNDVAVEDEWAPGHVQDTYAPDMPRDDLARTTTHAHMDPRQQRMNYATGPVGLRGGAGEPRGSMEFEAGDEAQFTAFKPPHRAFTQPAALSKKNAGYNTTSEGSGTPPPAPHPFRRTPTGLSMKQIKKKGAEHFEVDLEGGLDICLNVEVNQRDPAGITTPYRLLVPKLWYDYEAEEEEGGNNGQVEGGTGTGNRQGGGAAAPGGNRSASTTTTESAAVPTIPGAPPAPGTTRAAVPTIPRMTNQMAYPEEDAHQRAQQRGFALQRNPSDFRNRRWSDDDPNYSPRYN